MSQKEILDNFGKQLIRSVRDRTLEKYEKIATNSLRSQKGQELSNLISQFDDEQKKSIKTLIFETVDNSLFNVLDMIEQNEEEIKLMFSEQNVNEISDGLTGELFTTDGWIHRFSQIR